MKHFLKNSILFFVVLIAINTLLYIGLDLFYNTKTAKNSIFIWGDSQAYQGINLDTLKSKTNLKIYSAAQHGSGMFDLLVFAHKIPKKSNVVLTLSSPALTRPLDWDRNNTGLSIKALLNVYDSYSLGMLDTIIRKNLKPWKLFYSQTNMNPNRDTVTIVQPVSFFSNRYKEKSPYFKTKKELYLKAISILKEKECSISIIHFPYYKTLKNIEDTSKIKKDLNKLDTTLLSELRCNNITYFQLDTSKNVMFDLTHLNNNGAIQISNFLSKENLNEDNFFRIKIY